jgi:Tfp pilus assembly protein PilX
MKISAYSARRRQQGMTLVIGLIMLVMISLAAIASYQMSKTTLEVVGNMQYLNEAIASADSVLQEAMSREAMFTTPTNVLTNTCGANNTKCFDYNNDGTNDVRVTLQAPACVRAQALLISQLNLTPNAITGVIPDFGCAKQSELSGVEGANTGKSLCTETTWEMRATATDATAGTTGASATVTQGVGVRVKTTDADTFC